MRHMYGVTEAEIRDSWTIADFHRYRDAALDLLKIRGGLR